MGCQDEYQATFGASPVMNFTLEATTQSITHQRPPHTPAHPSAVPFLFTRLFSILVGAPQPRLNHFCFILQSIPPVSALLYYIPHIIPPIPSSSAWDRSILIPAGASPMHSTLLTHPLLALLRRDKHRSIPSLHFLLDWLASISFRTPQPPLFQRSSMSFRNLQPPLCQRISFPFITP
jgi:hypothetical protein